MATKQMDTSPSTETAPVKTPSNYQKLEEKSFKTHPEALAQVDAWRKQHKIPKKESVDNLHKVRIRLRANGLFDAVLYQKKLERKNA